MQNPILKIFIYTSSTDEKKALGCFQAPSFLIGWYFMMQYFISLGFQSVFMNEAILKRKY